MLPKRILAEILQTTLNFDEKKLATMADKALKLQKNTEEYLVGEGLVDENDLYTKASKIMGVELVDIKGKEIKKEVLNLVPPPLAQAHRLIAFEKTKDTISLAMLDPLDIQTIEFIQRKTGLKPKVFLATDTDIKDALRRYHADLSKDMMVVQLDENKKGVGNLKKVAEELPIINIVNNILEQAVFEGASDIHIEPEEQDVIIRYRIDGVLKTVMTLPKNVQSGIVARIKILAKLKIDEHMVPQDGRFKIKLQEDKLSFRVSIIPVYDGEKIVMRLLHESQKALSLDQLGFLPVPKKLVEQAIQKPHGMVLVTGPTGSGKTTTLYSILGLLNQPDVNISTIEDPIEYHVKGINQSQINQRAGFTFAGGLRAFLRQDPDIIMVGEIRDKETAEVAIHAAMTGHLVLSTLHTNDAPTTLPRLIDMDIPPFLVAFTANIIIAQRLVRKICPECKEEFHLEKEAVDELTKSFANTNIVELLTSQGIKLSDSEKTIGDMTFYRGAGCNKCNNSGYKGRMGIYEVLLIDDTLIEKINARATADDVKKYAREQQKMITIMQDGLIKSKMGITTIEEVLRVTRE